MPNYAQNIANKRRISPKQQQTNHLRLLLGMSYVRLQEVLGNAREDLMWSMAKFTLEQKVEMAQAWERYFVK